MDSDFQWKESRKMNEVNALRGLKLWYFLIIPFYISQNIEPMLAVKNHPQNAGDHELTSIRQEPTGVETTRSTWKEGFQNIQVNP